MIITSKKDSLNVRIDISEKEDPDSKKARALIIDVNKGEKVKFQKSIL